ncbi:MAG TPA: tRNA 2-thiouridine(34) synthase MnmA [Candidatus Taylorbacteria bacterium]|nr:MAG: tRNA (5-methylaminomethyl-2-thiouridylate)-methyltransferase [Parcubacteria group bacterium GW2011_GWA2_47_64]KKU96048.1 MAG: tRNA (5-methylaminomethyl-2-thiouridylate)-methyltransferase [Parcubacteria group bacterium GW2011_GWC2_48_17]HBV00832.1 tRNA 2-thiouridine(34) synthase MnmA [Candidatus Taylorbacteria bacterium]
MRSQGVYQPATHYRQPTIKGRVFVGLSGGVDSSVSAALLTQAGYDVTGVFIKVWQPDFFECSWKDDRLDAMRVCAKLGIPFKELDLTKEYKREVVDYMIREYKAGKTPNPDVMCNRFIKFGGFYKFARKQGADFIATGHYARIMKTQSTVHKNQTKHKTQNPKKLNAKRYTLNAGKDSSKDQSYFLWQIRSKQLPCILFPVGGMLKQEVRKLAKKFGLITADKKDSQGLCFVGKVDMKDFLKQYIKEKPGKVLDEIGNVIGKHDGAFFLTLGERHGFRITKMPTNSRPYYVIAKNTAKNTITVSPKSAAGNLAGGTARVEISDCNWLIKPQAGKTYLARSRYRQGLQKCIVIGTSIHFATSQTVAPGQSLVLYDSDTIVGGGVIESSQVLASSF